MCVCVFLNEYKNCVPVDAHDELHCRSSKVAHLHKVMWPRGAPPDVEVVHTQRLLSPEIWAHSKLICFFTVSRNRSNILCARRRIKSWTESCVRSHGATGAVPERGELRKAHGLDMDVRLSVEPSAGVLQLNGVDLTQSHGMRQHCLVRCSVCLTAGHKHTHTHRVYFCTACCPHQKSAHNKLY